MTGRIWVASAVLLGLTSLALFVGCERGTPPSPLTLEDALDPSETGMVSIWMYYPAASYTADVAVLRIEADAFEDTVRSCVDSLPELDVLTMPSIRCTVPYRIGDDSLRLLLWSDGDAGGGLGAGFGDTTAVVDRYLLLTREAGDGEGLVGRWHYAGLDWKLVRGALTDAEVAELNLLIDTPDSLFGRGMLPQVAVDFSADSVRVERLVPPVAETLFGVAGREAIDTMQYLVSIDRDSLGGLTLKGSTTGEVVVITVDAGGTIVYTSNDPLHESHVYYADFRRCPNPVLPAWFDTFLQSNRRR